MSEDSLFLRTLYIQEQGSVLRVSNDQFRVTTGNDDDESELIEIQSIKVGQIVIFGACMITPPALRYCLMKRIPIVLLSQHGEYFSRIESTDDVNIMLERDQFRLSTDDGFALDCSKHFIRAKLHNSMVLLKRRLPESSSASLLHAIGELESLTAGLEKASTLDAARGYEGSGAAAYFGVFEELFETEGFCFRNRIKRPPPDPVNAMLSFGYSLLFNNLFSMVRIHRMHPYVGFLHADKPVHPALVSDLIEEFRTIIDGLVLGIINKHLIGPGEFRIVHDEDGILKGCYLSDAARKVFLREFENLMHRETTHTATGYRVSYRRCLDLQVGQFALFLKKEQPYIPYLRR
ncbi:MAG: CRISPR-associated endonuclease Cas1 [Chlorobiaceae bacterium]|nr:CRISPR-associated endonuclease Cas1 [Chlorobiaceae bacterium]